MKIIIFLLLPIFTIFGQGRSDFYDNYDYDLKNYKGGGSLDGSESYKEYKIPPERPKPFKPTPKGVAKPPDPTQLIPAQSGLSKTTAPSVPQMNFNNLPVNPMTGELNVESILRNQDESKRKKEVQKKIRENFEPHAYRETQDRRSEIIFLMTLPFAFGIAAGIGAIADAFIPEHKNIYGRKTSRGFVYTQEGTAFISITAFGLAGGNVYLDRLRMEDFEREKRTHPVSDFLNPRPDMKFEYTIGTIQF
jgi:hypothetical protein